MCSTVTFGLCADLHADIMHDACERLSLFLNACRARDVDFAVQLGDLCYPESGRSVRCRPENTPINVANAMAGAPTGQCGEIARLLAAFDRPMHHVLGNHDLDFFDKREMCAFLRIGAPYASFSTGGFHFVILDANGYMADNAYTAYDHGNYFDARHGAYPYLGDEQLAWLEEDILRAGMPTCIFSHQALNPSLYGIRDHAKFRSCLRRLKAKGCRVRLCVNGHDHVDGLALVDGTHYLSLNSMSNAWLGEAYATTRYGAPVDDRFPNLRFVVPYRDPLFAFITVSRDTIRIEGASSRFIGPSPYAQGFPLSRTPYPVTPLIQTRTLALTE